MTKQRPSPNAAAGDDKSIIGGCIDDFCLAERTVIAARSMPGPPGGGHLDMGESRLTT